MAYYVILGPVHHMHFLHTEALIQSENSERMIQKASFGCMLRLIIVEFCFEK